MGKRKVSEKKSVHLVKGDHSVRKEKNPHPGAQYKLYAAVNHSGSLSFGHYTAHARVGEGTDKAWFHFNDARVTRADNSEVGTGAAYILFYERVHNQSGDGSVELAS